jgi:asparaginyl-tRNA synthetase
VRNQHLPSIHDFFQEEGFLYVHRRSSPPATAKARARCSGHHARSGESAQGTSKGGRLLAGLSSIARLSDRQRTIGGRIFATALGKVYTFGPTFRAENSNTSRHLAEFWMIEPEMAFFELTDNMDLAERFLKRIFRTCCPIAPRT